MEFFVIYIYIYIQYIWGILLVISVNVWKGMGEAGK